MRVAPHEVVAPGHAQLVEEVMGREVAGHESLEDLGFDSLGMLELLLVLEEVRGEPVPEEAVSSIRTVDDALAFAGPVRVGAQR